MTTSEDIKRLVESLPATRSIIVPPTYGEMLQDFACLATGAVLAVAAIIVAYYAGLLQC